MKGRPSRPEARREARRPIDINATISVDGRVIAARTRDMSRLGLCLISNAPIARNTELEIRLVVRRRLTLEEGAVVTDLVNKTYGGGFRCRIIYRDEILRAEGGKYFVFRSELPA